MKKILFILSFLTIFSFESVSADNIHKNCVDPREFSFILNFEKEPKYEVLRKKLKDMPSPLSCLTVSDLVNTMEKTYSFKLSPSCMYIPEDHRRPCYTEKAMENYRANFENSLKALGLTDVQLVKTSAR